MKSVLPGQQCSDFFPEIPVSIVSFTALPEPVEVYMHSLYPSFVFSLLQKQSLYIMWCFCGDVMKYSNFHISADLCSECCMFCGWSSVASSPPHFFFFFFFLHLRASGQGQKQEKKKARWSCRPPIDQKEISKEWPI